MANTLYAVPMLDALSNALSQAWTRLLPTGRKVALEQWLAHVGASSARAIH